MKIAYVLLGYDSKIGGYGKHVNLVSEELMRRGHQVTIITSKFRPGNSTDNKNTKRLWNSPFLKITPSLFTHLLGGKYDLVHVFGYPTFQPFISALAKSIKKFPLVFTPHYHPFGSKPSTLRRIFDFFIGNYVLNKSDHIIATTDYEKRMLSKKDRKISVIPNPIKISDLKKVRGFKNKHKFKGPYILFVGRIERDKGLQYLIPAVKGLPITLVVVGKDVGYKNELPRQDNVLFAGPVSDKELMMAYTECNCLVLPSKYESFGIVLIEAMSYGKPVISTKAGPVPSIVKDAGFVVPYGSIPELRNAIKKLSNPKLRSSMAKCAYRYSQVYDVKKVVDKLLIVYKKVLKKIDER